MTADKRYCMSSYLAFRFIENDDADFKDGMHHTHITPVPDESRTPVRSAEEMDAFMDRYIKDVTKGKRPGVLLSGGMDSAIVASYLPGADAYTFRFLGGEFQNAELKRAETFADRYDMRLHYVDISWKTVERYVDKVMERKCAPVHSIEPQILSAALQAKADGIDLMGIGESSDLVFGGMDQLLSKDWTVEEFQRRYMFTDPSKALKDPVDLSYVFERYRNGDRMDFLRFMNEVFSIESSSSYMNSFNTAGMEYFDPYAHMKMAEPLDLARIRSGDSKYLVRSLFRIRYPDLEVPEKVPMPRPVDSYFKSWKGPARPEFLEGLDMESFTGNQKWQLYCLERFLDRFM